MNSSIPLGENTDLYLGEGCNFFGVLFARNVAISRVLFFKSQRLGHVMKDLTGGLFDDQPLHVLVKSLVSEMCSAGVGVGDGVHKIFLLPPCFIAESN